MAAQGHRTKCQPIALLVGAFVLMHPPIVHAAPSTWCPEDMRELSTGTCVVPSNQADNSTLIVYLHGVIQAESGWQHGPIRAMATFAQRHGFAFMAPRGRRGIGPKTMEDWWTWPTAARAQEQVEADLFREWDHARNDLETKQGKRFERIYVFGFSNGAYYGSSLALRGVWHGTAYALFAGGSAPKHRERQARAHRAPPRVFVGYGLKDGAAVRDCRQLDRVLSRLRWPHRTRAVAKQGHAFTHSQLEQALQYFQTKE